MKEVIENLFKSIGERITSLFSITFVLVWIYFHWELVYSIVFFDSSTRLNSRIEFIKEYISLHGSLKLLWLPIGYTFIALFLYYIFNAISLAISTGYSRWLKPLVFNILDRNKIVDKDAHSELKSNYQKLQNEHEITKDTVSELRKVNESLTKVNEDLTKEINEVEDMQISIDKSKKELSELKNLNKELSENNESQKLDIKYIIEEQNKLNETIKKYDSQLAKKEKEISKKDSENFTLIENNKKLLSRLGNNENASLSTMQGVAENLMIKYLSVHRAGDRQEILSYKEVKYSFSIPTIDNSIQQKVEQILKMALYKYKSQYRQSGDSTIWKIKFLKEFDDDLNLHMALDMIKAVGLDVKGFQQE